MNHERMSPEQESNPRDKTLQIIHLLERLPHQNGLDAMAIAHLNQDKYERNQAVKEFSRHRGEQADQRNKSEFKHAYFQKYDRIMQSSKITKNCQEYLSWSLNQSYDIGINIEAPIEEIALKEFTLFNPLPTGFDYLIEDYVDHPQSAGIFESETASALESEIYTDALNSQKLLEGYLKKTHKNESFLFILPMIKEFHGVPIKGDTVDAIFGHYDSLMANWQVQIMQQHGIILPSDVAEIPEL